MKNMKAHRITVVETDKKTQEWNEGWIYGAACSCGGSSVEPRPSKAGAKRAVRHLEQAK